jgi:uncharacterized membrane protein YecN with MAPEG domain
MNSFYWFGIFVGLNALILLLLTANVSRLRLKYKVSLGNGKSKQLKLARKAHANAVEQIPIYGLLILALTYQHPTSTVIPLFVIAFTAARICHAYGMISQVFFMRRLGAALTYLLQLISIVTLLLHLAV